MPRPGLEGVRLLHDHCYFGSDVQYFIVLPLETRRLETGVGRNSALLVEK